LDYANLGSAMLAGMMRAAASLVLAAPLAALTVPAAAGGNFAPAPHGYPHHGFAHAAPHYAQPAHAYPHHAGREDNLRKRPFYWFRPGVKKMADLEVVPSCYMKRQRVWLDRYTYTNRYHRHCD
jgi:hypothetical protein